MLLFHYFEKSSTVFTYLACFLNSQDIFKERYVSQRSDIHP